jgi:2-polyprenyl-3-methyl-5-hydroxy-6-metoxy-1,4-benzoquinol methylase
MSYSAFARCYDSLTRNVNYAGRADYLCAALSRLTHKPGLTLDMACGTGSLTLELAKRGFDVFGLDASPEMLSIAQHKACAAGKDILFICQKMQEMDLYGTVDTVICMLDSINHILSLRELEETFRRVSLFLNPGGCFLFDVNTVYKHCKILADNVFVYDIPDVYCVWQNRLEPKNACVAVSLDFFVRHGMVYERTSEHFSERAYQQEAVCAILKKVGLEVKAVWGDLTFQAPGPKEERMVFAVCKPGNSTAAAKNPKNHCLVVDK